VVIIPDQPEEGINSYGGKDFEKRKVLRQVKKRHEKGQQVVPDQSMMMDRTDKEHEEVMCLQLKASPVIQ